MIHYHTGQIPSVHPFPVPPSCAVTVAGTVPNDMLQHAAQCLGFSALHGRRVEGGLGSMDGPLEAHIRAFVAPILKSFTFPIRMVKNGEPTSTPIKLCSICILIVH